MRPDEKIKETKGMIGMTKVRAELWKTDAGLLSVDVYLGDIHIGQTKDGGMIEALFPGVKN